MPRKAKFNAEEYIDTNYVEDEDAIISIYIHEISNFYNEFDADDLTLSDEILSFIDNRAENISHEYNIVLEFDSPKISNEEKERITNIIKSHYGLSHFANNKEIGKNKIKSLIFLFLGIIFLLLSYITNNYVNLISDILSIAGWVSIWETVSVLFFDNVENRTNKRNIDRLYNAKVVFKERKD